MKKEEEQLQEKKKVWKSISGDIDQPRLVCLRLICRSNCPVIFQPLSIPLPSLMHGQYVHHLLRKKKEKEKGMILGRVWRGSLRMRKWEFLLRSERAPADSDQSFRLQLSSLVSLARSNPRASRRASQHPSSAFPSWPYKPNEKKREWKERGKRRKERRKERMRERKALSFPRAVMPAAAPTQRETRQKEHDRKSTTEREERRKERKVLDSIDWLLACFFMPMAEHMMNSSSLFTFSLSSRLQRQLLLLLLLLLLFVSDRSPTFSSTLLSNLVSLSVPLLQIEEEAEMNNLSPAAAPAAAPDPSALTARAIASAARDRMVRVRWVCRFAIIDSISDMHSSAPFCWPAAAGPPSLNTPTASGPRIDWKVWSDLRFVTPAYWRHWYT